MQCNGFPPAHSTVGFDIFQGLWNFTFILDLSRVTYFILTSEGGRRIPLGARMNDAYLGIHRVNR